MHHYYSYPRFQRRVQAIKMDFLKRCTTTPLGMCHDFWDRTEAQQRGALHSHILVWFRKRHPHPNWVALPPVPRTVKGDGPKQRHDSAGSGSLPLPQGRIQHDTCYQLFEMGRVSGEMVRPIVTHGGDWGGFDVEMLRIGECSVAVLG